MKKPIHKQNNDNKLPRFRAEVLAPEELGRVKGGMPPETGSTHSVCHVDGVCDGCTGH